MKKSKEETFFDKCVLWFSNHLTNNQKEFADNREKDKLEHSFLVKTPLINKILRITFKLEDIIDD